MSLPKYLENNDSLIVLDKDSVVNHSIANFDQETFSFSADGEYTIYLDNFSLPKLDLVIEENHNVIVYLISDNSRKTKISMNIQVKDNALLKLYSQFNSKRRTSCEVNRQFHIEYNASLILLNNLTYRGEIRLDDQIYLEKELANLDIDQLNINSTDDLSVVKQHVYHQAKKTYSQIHNWLISNDNSKLDYVVNGTIEKGHEKSSCQQLNKGIIISDKGQIKVIPSLFIDEYDVEASHGAAIGQIDENQMFYLRSRGMNELEAKNLIISGYINPFITKVKNEAIESSLARKIKRLL